MGTHPIFESDFDCLTEMTGRAIPAAVNWAALLKQTAPADRKLMAAFKLKSDAISGNYAKAAAFKREIDWAHYEANVSKSGFVADFKAKYEATEIPVPSDGGLEADLEAKAAADEIAVADYVKKVDGQIADASVTLNNIKALPPFEQMTQADILFYFPQLCRNQESIFNSENCRHQTLLGAKTSDLRMVDGIKWVAFQQADEDAAQSHPTYRLDEAQYPGAQYPAFFSSFPTAEFNESFALADPLIQWEQIAHHPEFDAHVAAVQAEYAAPAEE